MHSWSKLSIALFCFVYLSAACAQEALESRQLIDLGIEPEPEESESVVSHFTIVVPLIGF